ncbi:hypothetical protein ACLK19_05035 [Escherichia coli]
MTSDTAWASRLTSRPMAAGAPGAGVNPSHLEIVSRSLSALFVPVSTA